MPFKFIRDIKSYQIYHMNSSSNHFDLAEKNINKSVSRKIN
jgi:hypothetical protein